MLSIFMLRFYATSIFMLLLYTLTTKLYTPIKKYVCFKMKYFHLSLSFLIKSMYFMYGSPSREIFTSSIPILALSQNP